MNAIGVGDAESTAKQGRRRPRRLPAAATAAPPVHQHLAEEQRSHPIHAQGAQLSLVMLSRCGVDQIKRVPCENGERERDEKGKGEQPTGKGRRDLGGAGSVVAGSCGRVVDSDSRWNTLRGCSSGRGPPFAGACPAADWPTQLPSGPTPCV